MYVLQDFHRRIGHRHKFTSIADFVRHKPLNLNYENYEDIAKTVFQHKDNWMEFIEILSSSYESYNIVRIS